MKKIAFIELDTHAEIASNFYEIMHDSDVFSVDFYFSKKILSQLHLSENENIFLSDSNVLLSQLKNKNYEFVMIGTIHRYFHLFYRVSKIFKTASIVHNLNFKELKKRQLFPLIFKEDVLYRIKLALKEGLFLLPKLKENVSQSFVLDEVLENDKVKYLPLFFNQFSSQKNTSDKMKVVISGRVSQRRRDYKRVINQLKNTTQKMEVVFLGKAEGEELKAIIEFDKNKPSSLEIVYFTEKVPQLVYDDYMQKADILWCPIQRETSFFSQKEIYGQTKMSGAVGDAIKYGKMALFPKNYQSNLSFIIQENDLPIEVQFQEMKRLNYDFQNDFSKGKVRNQLQKVLIELYQK